MDAISTEIQIALPADPKLLTTLIKYQLLLLQPLAFELQPSGRATSLHLSHVLQTESLLSLLINSSSPFIPSFLLA